MKDRYILNNNDKLNKTLIKSIIKDIKDDDFIIDLKASARGKEQYICNCPVSFDIETTSYNNHGQRVGIMYLWGVSIKDSNIIGRNWQQFKDLIDVLQKTLKLNENKQLIIWVHNLGFEFTWLKSLFKFDDVFAVAPQKPIYARTGGITFRDSYILSGLSLEKTAEQIENVNINKLVGTVDYSLYRTPNSKLEPELIEYLVNDIDIVYYYIKQQLDIYKYMPVIPLTNTSRVRNKMRNNCLYKTKNSGKRINNIAYTNLMDHMKMSEEEYSVLKDTYWGAYTHSNFRRTDKKISGVSSWDEASAYPAALLSRKFPVGPARKLDLDNITAEELNYALMNTLSLIEIEASDLYSSAADDFLSENRCIDLINPVINNGRIHACDYYRGRMTNIDFQIFLKAYDFDEFNLIEVWVYDEVDYLPKEFLEVVLELYEDKTKLKGNKEKKVEYNLKKSMLNAIYGMLMQDLDKNYNVLDDEGNWKQVSKELSKAIKKINNSNAKFYDYRWGVFVTSYARYNLWLAIQNIGQDYIYSDTDSVKITNNDKHLEFFNKYNSDIAKMTDECLKAREIDPERARPNGKQIGAWDYEGTYTFKTIGAKRYLTEDEKGKLELTCAGVGKKGGTEYLSTFEDPFEAFKDGIIFPAEYSGKLISHYNGKREGDIIDLNGESYHYIELSSLCLEPSDTEISLAEDFKRQIEKMKGTIING